jgi:outer membrane protein
MISSLQCRNIKGRCLTHFVCGLSILLSTLPIAVSAQSLIDLFDLASKSDPGLASAQAEYQASAERIRQARAAMLPVAAIVGSSTSSNFAPDGDVPISRADYRSRQWSFQLSQPVYRPALSWALREADVVSASTREQLDAVQSDLLIRLVSAYFDVLSAREVRVSLHKQRAAALQQKIAAKRSFELGTASITDYRDAEAKHDLLKAQEIRGENDLLLKQAALQQMLGDSTFNLRILPREAPEPTLGTEELPWLIEQAVASNPSARQAQLQLDASMLKVKKARRGHYPTLDLVLSYGSDRSTGTPLNPVPIYGRTMQAQANLNVPLFSGLGTDAKIKEAIALESKARADVEASRRAIATSVREAFYGVKSALDQIASLKTAEKSAEISVMANRKSYRAGISTTSDVLNAEAQFFQTRRDLMKAKLEAWMNRIKLQVALGLPWQDGVDSVDHLLIPETDVADDQVLESVDGLTQKTEKAKVEKLNGAKRGRGALSLRLTEHL